MTQQAPRAVISIEDPEPVIVVSGLPRSGTSMMMRMLEAAGLPVLTDGRRQADPDNPNGYYELDRVKGLERGDSSWIAEAQGRVVKVVSPLLQHLPEGREYRVVVMERDAAEVLASQRRMLARRGEPVRDMDDRVLAELYADHRREVRSWAGQTPGVSAVFVDYNDLLVDARPWLERIHELVGRPIDLEAMAAIVEPGLHRSRGPEPGR